MATFSEVLEILYSILTLEVAPLRHQVPNEDKHAKRVKRRAKNEKNKQRK